MKIYWRSWLLCGGDSFCVCVCVCVCVCAPVSSHALWITVNGMWVSLLRDTWWEITLEWFCPHVATVYPCMSSPCVFADTPWCVFRGWDGLAAARVIQILSISMLAPLPIHPSPVLCSPLIRLYMKLQYQNFNSGVFLPFLSGSYLHRHTDASLEGDNTHWCRKPLVPIPLPYYCNTHYMY